MSPTGKKLLIALQHGKHGVDHLKHVTPGIHGTIIEATPAASTIAAAQAELSALDITRAARVLSSVMDYPWEHMSNDGRDRMRANAKLVIDAALATRGATPPQAKEEE